MVSKPFLSNNCYDCRSFLFRLQFFLKLFLFGGVERREFFSRERRELAHCRQPEDTKKHENARAFLVKSELSGSMKSDAFEYEIAVASVRNR